MACWRAAISAPPGPPGPPGGAPGGAPGGPPGAPPPAWPDSFCMSAMSSCGGSGGAPGAPPGAPPGAGGGIMGGAVAISLFQNSVQPVNIASTRSHHRRRHSFSAATSADWPRESPADQADSLPRARRRWHARRQDYQAVPSKMVLGVAYVVLSGRPPGALRAFVSLEAHLAAFGAAAPAFTRIGHMGEHSASYLRWRPRRPLRRSHCTCSGCRVCIANSFR